MTDIDLNRWSAEKVMGWTIGYVYGLPCYQDFYIKFDINDWHPLTNYNQLFMVVEKMRELGWHFSLHYDEFGIGCVFYPHPHDGKVRRINRSNDLPTAVLRAAYEVLKGENVRYYKIYTPV